MKITHDEVLGIKRVAARIHELFPGIDLDETFFSGFNDNARSHVLLGVQLLSEALSRVKEHTVALQAGGCHGLYPLYIDRACPVELEAILSFEPDPYNFTVMQGNVADFEVGTRIALYAAALDRDAGYCSVKRTDGNPGASVIQAGDDAVVLTIDMVMDNADMGVLGLLVLDVEGAEVSALTGGKHTIQRDRPVIMYEHCHDEQDAVFEMLTAWGYAVVDEDPYNRVMVNVRGPKIHQ